MANCITCGKFAFGNDALCVNCQIKARADLEKQIQSQNEERKYTYWGRYDRAIEMGCTDEEALQCAEEALRTGGN